MAYISTEMSDSLTDEHLESLHKANIWTINDLLTRDLMDIKRYTNIKFHILKDIVDKIKIRYNLPVKDMNYVLEKSINECKMCPTGLPELTFALDGGFQTQEIVEFVGESESGKTEMCYLLCGEILSHFDDYNILYIASNFDFDYEKIIKYTRSKGGNKVITDEDIYKSLDRIDIAKPLKLGELVHLLNTVIHSDRRNRIRCIIIDSLSFIIQEEILDIRSTNLDDSECLEKMLALKGMTLKHHDGSTPEGTRKEIIDIYLHEVMRLITTIALTKNVIVIVTNSDQNLTYRKPWINAMDHRIQLSKMPEYSKYRTDNPKATVCRATILKTIHNISRIGYSIPFAINDEGLFAIRQTSSSDKVLD